MTASESLVFCAFLDERSREAAWKALAESDLFCTEQARRLAQTILSSFPQSPPGGSAKTWIGEIEDEESRGLLADIQFYVGFKVSGRLVEDSVSGFEEALNSLRKQREERHTKVLKSPAAEGEDRLRKLQEHLASKVKGTYEYSEEEKERRIRL
jgi:hypothetical protein